MAMSPTRPVREFQTRLRGMNSRPTPTLAVSPLSKPDHQYPFSTQYSCIIKLFRVIPDYYLIRVLVVTSYVLDATKGDDTPSIEGLRRPRILAQDNCPS